MYSITIFKRKQSLIPEHYQYIKLLKIIQKKFFFARHRTQVCHHQHYKISQRILHLNFFNYLCIILRYKKTSDPRLRIEMRKAGDSRSIFFFFTSLSLCVSFSRKCLRKSTGSSTIQFQMTFSATSLTDTPSPPTSPSASRWMMGRTAAQIQDGKNVWACCMWWRCSARSSSPVPKQQSHSGLHQK